MNSPQPSSNTSNTGVQVSPTLLDQTEYNDCTKLWHDIVSGNQDLNPYFTEGGQRLLYSYFSASTIVNLVSTPAIQDVKVRFGILNDQFAVIAFASDAQGKPVSAYFLSQNSTDDSLGDADTTGGGPGEEVPQELAESWIGNWADAPNVIQDQFVVDQAGMEGYLRGYTFNAADFRDTLLGDGIVTDQMVRVRYALHEYYRAGSSTLSSTFGLVLDSDGPSGPSGTFFDLSAPCPPTC